MTHARRLAVRSTTAHAAPQAPPLWARVAAWRASVARRVPRARQREWALRFVAVVVMVLSPPGRSVPARRLEPVQVLALPAPVCVQVRALVPEKVQSWAAPALRPSAAACARRDRTAATTSMRHRAQRSSRSRSPATARGPRAARGPTDRLADARASRARRCVRARRPLSSTHRGCSSKPVLPGQRKTLGSRCVLPVARASCMRVVGPARPSANSPCVVWKPVTRAAIALS